MIIIIYYVKYIYILHNMLPFTKKRQGKDTDMSKDGTNPKILDIKSEELKNTDDKPITLEQTRHIEKSNLKLDITSDKISIHNENNETIGTFSIYDLMKFVANNDIFLRRELSSLGDVSFPRKVIEEYICFYENRTLKLQSYLKSSIMGDIQFCIHLYNLMNNYEKKILDSNLVEIDTENAMKIRDNIINFMLMFMQHIMNIINELMSNKNTGDIQQQLMKYSVAILYKFTKLLQQKTNSLKEDFTSLNSNFAKLNSVEEKISSQLDEIKGIVKFQTEQISKCEFPLETHTDKLSKQNEFEQKQIEQKQSERKQSEQKQSSINILSDVHSDDIEDVVVENNIAISAGNKYNDSFTKFNRYDDSVSSNISAIGGNIQMPEKKNTNTMQNRKNMFDKMIDNSLFDS